jgi:hypothetical protein
LKKTVTFVTVFFMAPLVGLEPTTCGLTDHEPRPQKPKQAITKPPCPTISGDHPATSDQKMPITKMVKRRQSPPQNRYQPDRGCSLGENYLSIIINNK